MSPAQSNKKYCYFCTGGANLKTGCILSVLNYKDRIFTLNIIIFAKGLGLIYSGNTLLLYKVYTEG